MRIILLAIVAMFASLTMATAKQVKVPANKTTYVGVHGTFSSDTCSGGTIPKLSLGRKPKHGKVTFKPVGGKLSEGPCKGSYMRGTGVFYRPNSGNRGSDSFSVEYQYNYFEGAAKLTHTSRSYRIEVQ